MNGIIFILLICLSLFTIIKNFTGNYFEDEASFIAKSSIANRENYIYLETRSEDIDNVE